VSTIVKEPANDDGDSEVLTFAYDDAGRVEEVRKVEGDVTRTWTLGWDEGVLATVVIERDDGGAVEEVARTFSYESARLVRVQSDDEASEATFAYDEQGRLVEQSGAVTTTLAYDERGRIESMRSDARAVELVHGEEQLERLTVSEEGEEPQAFEFSFDDDGNQLERISLVADVAGFVDFSYDDEGRVQRAVHTAAFGDITADVAVTNVEYEDGDASALDASANQVVLFGMFFDMKGGSHVTFDNATMVPRLAFSSW
jgi:YD repeat-containing protein